MATDHQMNGFLHQYFHLDMKPYLLDLVNPKISVKVLTPLTLKSVQSYLKKKNFILDQPALNQEKLVYSQILDHPRYRKVILCLSKLLKKVDHFITWDSDLSKQLFDTLMQTKWKIKMLIFIDNNIGNNFATYLTSFKTENLTLLYFYYESIGSKGIKLLFRLDFSSLRLLYLTRTDITDDSIKVFKKKPGLYQHIHLVFFKNYSSYHLLHQTAFELFGNNEIICICQRTHEDEKKNYFFFNYLAKLHFIENTITTVSSRIKNYSNEKFQPIVSEKAVNKLQLFIDFSN